MANRIFNIGKVKVVLTDTSFSIQGMTGEIETKGTPKRVLIEELVSVIRANVISEAVSEAKNFILAETSRELELKLTALFGE